MEVEQRIGRLDRIGQESPIIRIYNLWVKDTIEERILKRLYERIDIFERSVGDLEMILGDVFQRIESDFLSKELTKEEEKDKIDEAMAIINRKKLDLEKLDQDSANFIGTDAFFENEIAAISDKKRYITGEQIRIFLQDFIKNNAPLTRIEYNTRSKTGIIYPDDKLQRFIVSSGKNKELRHFLINTPQVNITFDNEVAFQKPNIEFLSLLHPLIISIVEHYQKKEEEIPNAHHIVLKTKQIAEGFYFYFIFRLRITGGKNSNNLEFILVNENFSSLPLAEGESLMAEMLEKGENNTGQSLEIPQEYAKESYQVAEQTLQQHIAELRQKKQEEAEHFCERRQTSITSSYVKSLTKQNELLEKAKENNRTEKYIKMLEGTKNRLQREWDVEKSKVEQMKTVGFEYDKIAAGVLEVINNE